MWLLGLLACSPAPLTLDTTATTGPTWAQDVAPVVESRCAGCHVSGGGAPFALDSFEAAGPRAAQMLAAVDAGTMPPWGAVETDECTPRFGWQDDARLSDTEKDTLRAWVNAGAPHAPDRTGVRLRWQHEAPEHEVVYTSIGNFSSEADGLLPEADDRREGVAEFRVPAGKTSHTETMRLNLPDPGRYPLFAVEAHMHLVGTDLLATVTREDVSVADGAAEECLMHEPAWDFDWQRMYRYDAPLGAVSLGQGDTITVRCTYDNTLDNPGVQRALDDAGLDEPVDVYLGEQSTDEMCLLIIGVTYDP